MNTHSVNISAQNISLLFPKNIKSDYLFNDIISVLPAETELDTTASMQIPFDSVLTTMKSDTTPLVPPAEKELLAQKLLSSLDSEDGSDLNGTNYFMIPKSVLYELTNNSAELPESLDIESLVLTPEMELPISATSNPAEKLSDNNPQNGLVSTPSVFADGESVSINYGGIKYRMEIITGEEAKLLINKINENANTADSISDLIPDNNLAGKIISPQNNGSDEIINNYININNNSDNLINTINIRKLSDTVSGNDKVANNKLNIIDASDTLNGHDIKTVINTYNTLKAAISNESIRTIKPATVVKNDNISNETVKSSLASLNQISGDKPGDSKKTVISNKSVNAPLSNPVRKSDDQPEISNTKVISKETPVQAKSKDLSLNNSKNIEISKNIEQGLLKNDTQKSSSPEVRNVYSQNVNVVNKQKTEPHKSPEIPVAANPEEKTNVKTNIKVAGGEKPEYLTEQKLNIKRNTDNLGKAELINSRNSSDVKTEFHSNIEKNPTQPNETLVKDKTSSGAEINNDSIKNRKVELPKIIKTDDSGTPVIKITSADNKIEKKSTENLQNEVKLKVVGGNKEIEDRKLPNDKNVKEATPETGKAAKEPKIIYHLDRTPTTIEKIENFEKIGNLDRWNSSSDKSMPELNPKTHVNSEFTGKNIDNNIYKVKSGKEAGKEGFAFIKLTPDAKAEEPVNHPFLSLKENNGISLEELNKFNLRIDNALSNNNERQYEKTPSEIKRNNLEIFKIDNQAKAPKSAVFPLDNILTKISKNEVSKKDEKRASNVLSVDKKTSENTINQPQNKTDKNNSSELTGDRQLNTAQKSDQTGNTMKTGNFENLIRNNMQGNGEVSDIIKNNSMRMPKAGETKFVNFNDTPAELTKLVTSGKSGSVELRINPKELGSVKILIDISQNVVNARVDVENEAVRNLIASNITQLKEVMQQSGLILNQFNINYQSNNSRSKAKNNSTVKNGKVEKIDNLEDFSSDEAAPVQKNMGYNSFDYLV